MNHGTIKTDPVKIDRRQAVGALTGAFVGSALLSLVQPARAQGTSPGAMAMAPGAKLGMSQYKKFTLMGGTFAKQTSELALQQATHPKVKQFAQFEFAEQTTLAQVLTDMNDPPPAPLDPGHAAKLKDLQAQSGKAFDAAYIQGQIAGHQELLSIQQGYLNAMPTDTDSKHAAMLARTSIQMHLVMLTDIQSMLGA